MKSCRITKELQQKVSTNRDLLMCTECGRTAKTSAALECHMKSLHGMSVKLLKCNVCEKEFRSYYEFETHKREHEIIQNLKSKNKSTLKSLIFNEDNDIDCEDNSDTNPSWTSTKEDEQLLKEDEDQVDFLCDQCDFETTSQLNLNNHVESKHRSI